MQIICFVFPGDVTGAGSYLMPELQIKCLVPPRLFQKESSIIQVGRFNLLKTFVYELFMLLVY